MKFPFFFCVCEKKMALSQLTFLVGRMVGLIWWGWRKGERWHSQLSLSLWGEWGIAISFRMAKKREFPLSSQRDRMVDGKKKKRFSPLAPAVSRCQPMPPHPPLWHGLMGDADEMWRLHIHYAQDIIFFLLGKIRRGRDSFARRKHTAEPRYLSNLFVHSLPRPEVQFSAAQK